MYGVPPESRVHIGNYALVFIFAQEHPAECSHSQEDHRLVPFFQCFVLQLFFLFLAAGLPVLSHETLDCVLDEFLIPQISLIHGRSGRAVVTT